MRRFMTVMAALILTSVASSEMTMDSDGDDIVLTWDPVEDEYEYLLVAFSPDEYDGGGLEWGAAVLKVLPDEETAEFPVEAVISPGYFVVPSTCIGCGLCVVECPTGAISLSDGKAVIDPETCILCGLCTSSCPTDAIVTLTDSGRFVLFGVDSEGGATVLEEL